VLPRITESARVIDQEDTEGSEHGCAVSSALNARHLLRTAQGMYAKNAGPQPHGHNSVKSKPIKKSLEDFLVNL